MTTTNNYQKLLKFVEGLAANDKPNCDLDDLYDNIYDYFNGDEYRAFNFGQSAVKISIARDAKKLLAELGEQSE